MTPTTENQVGPTIDARDGSARPVGLRSRFAFPPHALPCPALAHHMFANLLQLISGKPPPPEVERNAFIESVHVADNAVEHRDPRTERLILICWIFIAIKHVLIIWACQRYPVPFHQLWINFPTWVLGLLATGLYFGQSQPLRK